MFEHQNVTTDETCKTLISYSKHSSEKRRSSSLPRDEFKVSLMSNALRCTNDKAGVSFRYFTREEAEKSSITGWCRNTPDSKVEGEAQGTDKNLTTFLKAVDDGPPHARVVQVTKEERDVVDGESAFEIRH